MGLAPEDYRDAVKKPGSRAAAERELGVSEKTVREQCSGMESRCRASGRGSRANSPDFW